MYVVRTQPFVSKLILVLFVYMMGVKLYRDRHKIPNFSGLNCKTGPLTSSTKMLCKTFS